MTTAKRNTLLSDGTCFVCRGSGKDYGWREVFIKPGDIRVMYTYDPCTCYAGTNVSPDPQIAACRDENQALIDNAEDLMPF